VRVLVDECVPVKLVRLLDGHDFITAKSMGWGSFRNGKLLSLAEEAFDVFLTCDHNMEYQQNLKSRKIAILALSTNHWPTLRKHYGPVQQALNVLTPGSYKNLEIPES